MQGSQGLAERFLRLEGAEAQRGATRRAELVGQIREVHKENREVYGSPRIHRELAARGIACCENTVAKLMRQAEIRFKARRRFVV